MKLLKGAVYGFTILGLFFITFALSGFAADDSLEGRYQYRVTVDSDGGGYVTITKYLTDSSDTTAEIPDIIEGLPVTGIAADAFLGNNTVKEIRIPSSVREIQHGALAGNAVSHIVVASGNENYLSEDGILYNKQKTILMLYPYHKVTEKFTLPEQIQEIAPRAFSAVTVGQIVIKNGSVRIGEGNFAVRVPGLEDKYTVMLCPVNSFAAAYAKSAGLEFHSLDSGGQPGVQVSYKERPSKQNRSTWVKDDKGWRLKWSTGTYARSEKVLLDGKWYWIDEDGYRLTGWNFIEGDWYYMNPDGVMVQSDWTFQDGKWYYLKSDGAMLQGWTNWKGKWYYCQSPDGSLMVDTVTPDGYRVDKNGARIGREPVVKP